MRAPKSYLAAHPSSSKLNQPKHCPTYGKEQETVSNAILCCQSTSNYRERLLQGLYDVSPDSPLTTSKALLLGLAAFIRATTTIDPPDIFPSLPS